MKTFILFILAAQATLMAHEKPIDLIVQEAIEQFHIPGMAVAVVVEDKVFVCKGYGIRDVENQLPITQNTIFPICSNTKAFTSMLLAQLVEEGKIGWDDPVIKYIPNFRLYSEELTRQVTIRDLLAHRTGIPRHDALWYVVRDLSETDILAALPHFPPMSGLRETFQYSNLMYVIAGMIIQNITGNTWEEQISSRILQPLGMEHSGILTNYQNMTDAALPYAQINGNLEKLPFFNLGSVLAGGGVYSSITDMSKWLQMHLSDTAHSDFIQQLTMQEMQTIHMPFSSSESGYGLGWKIGTYKDQKRVFHDGLNDGFSSLVSFLPEKRLGIVLLANSSSDGLSAFSSIETAIYDLFLETPSSLEKYVGSYTHPAYGTMEISIDQGTLIGTLGKMMVPLKEKQKGIFEAKIASLLNFKLSPLVKFSFFSNGNEEVTEVQVFFEQFRGNPPVIFKK